MTCIARTIFASFSASVHQDVGIRMRRLRRLEYASAATQAQGTAPGPPCWRSPCLLSALTPPFHATRLAALVSLAIWRQFRSCCTERSVVLVLPISLSFALMGTVQSFVLLYHPTISPVTRYAFLVNSPSLRIQTIPEYFDH